MTLTPFQKRLQHVHNRLSDAECNGVTVRYVRPNQFSLEVVAMPVRQPAEMGIDVPVQTERQQFYIAQSELVFAQQAITPAVNDRIVWNSEAYKVVIPFANINPKSESAQHDYTTSGRDVLKIETIRATRRDGMGNS